MNTDLTVGKAEQVLWKFCIPLFGSIIFQQLYNLADSWVAGKFIGEQALAAVGNSYEITLIFLAFAFGCNIGCSVVVSRLFGGKNYRDMKTAVSTAMIASAVLCAVLMAFGIASGGMLLQRIHTPREILSARSPSARCSRSGRCSRRKALSVSASAAVPIPFSPMGEQENAVFCQECPTFPKQAVATVSITVGTAQAASPTSVDPETHPHSLASKG